MQTITLHVKSFINERETHDIKISNGSMISDLAKKIFTLKRESPSTQKNPKEGNFSLSLFYNRKSIYPSSVVDYGTLSDCNIKDGSLIYYTLSEKPFSPKIKKSSTTTKDRHSLTFQEIKPHFQNKSGANNARKSDDTPRKNLSQSSAKSKKGKRSSNITSSPTSSKNWLKIVFAVFVIAAIILVGKKLVEESP